MAKGDLTLEIDSKTWHKAEMMLYKMGELHQNHVIDKALRGGQYIFRRLATDKYNRAIGRTSKATGKLIRSIKVDIKKSIEDAKSNQGFRGGAGHVAHLVDRGTKARYTKKGAYRGIMYKGRKTKYYTPTGDRLKGFWSKANKKGEIHARYTVLHILHNEIRKIYNKATR